MLDLEVLVLELHAVDGLAARARAVREVACVGSYRREISLGHGDDVEATRRHRRETLRRGPPWSMKFGMTRWNDEPL